MSARSRFFSIAFASITYVEPGTARSGRSYMMSSMYSSITARSARAPVSRARARSASRFSASSVNSSDTSSRLKRCWY